MEIAIKPQPFYYNGKMIDCDLLVVESTRDNFSDSADIYYGIGNKDNKGINQGILTISGTDYVNWNVQPDANAWIGIWVKKQLNLK